MNLETIEMIRQKHLTTKKALEAEATKKAREHEAAVEAFCEKLLGHLNSDAAYDSEGVYMDGGVCYKDTAWVKIAYGTDALNHVIKGTTRIELPNNTYAEYLDYNWGEGTFMRILHDALNEFERLEGFEVIGYRIVMKLEERK